MTLIRIKVKPRARISVIKEVGDGSFVAHLKASPVDGDANRELIALVATHFGCSKAAVSIKSGAASRTKLLKIDAI